MAITMKNDKEAPTACSEQAWRADSSDSRWGRGAARCGRSGERANLPDVHVYVFFDGGNEALG